MKCSKLVRLSSITFYTLIPHLRVRLEPIRVEHLIRLHPVGYLLALPTEVEKVVAVKNPLAYNNEV